MNEIVNKFSLAGEKVMSEMHLRQSTLLDKSGFTYSACRPFTKNKERIQKFKEKGDSRYIYQKELDEACFEYDMAYGDFKGLTRRTASDKILRDKAFNIAKNPKYDGYQRGLASMVYRFFDKSTTDGTVKNAEELHKQIIRKFNKRKVQSPFIGNIWGADLADIQLISKFSKGICFLLCVINIYSKYAWVIPLKDKKGVTITNAFQIILKESYRKSNKIWVDKGSEKNAIEKCYRNVFNT